MNIVIVSPEAVPYAKTGGLADVAGALYGGISASGHNVSMFLPCYRHIKKDFRLNEIHTGVKASLGERSYYYDVYSHDNSYFISNKYFFDRDGFYGDSRGDFPDNAERFAFFCSAVLQSIKSLNLSPDVIHLNDWQTGIMSFYQKKLGALSKNTKTVLTIHNVGYQGLFPPDVLPKIGVPAEYFSMDSFEFYGNVNLLKAGIIYSDQITTVSPNYQKEITTTELGYGLGDLLKSKKVTGILNGIDTHLWDPKKDKAIRKNFDKINMNGKISCKHHICEQLGIQNRTLPLIGVIGRFSSQKGYDIIAESLDDIIKLKANVVILGKGDLSIENSLRTVASYYPENISLNIGFDDQLARRIYAGSDMFLMPSRYEPCGVAQMIAMRYGSVPVVRMTGGLVDTVKDFNTGNTHGNGFVFAHADRHSMLGCIKRALCVFKNDKEWSTIVHNAMESEFPWKEAVEKYLSFYSSLTAKR